MIRGEGQIRTDAFQVTDKMLSYGHLMFYSPDNYLFQFQVANEQFSCSGRFGSHSFIFSIVSEKSAR